MYNLVPVSEGWYINASGYDLSTSRVSWKPFNVSNSLIAGYVVVCNSTNPSLVNVSYAITDNRSSFAACENLVGLATYRVQVMAYLQGLPEETRMYKSMAVDVATKKLGEFLLQTENFDTKRVVGLL